MNLLAELSSYKQFLREYTLQMFRTRYRGSILGFGWTLAMPFISVATLGLVFSQINRSDMRVFGPHFLGGYVAWILFASAITNSIGSVTSNPQFVNRVYAPKVVFPVAGFLMALVEFAAFFVSSLVILSFFGFQFKLTMLFLPFAALILIPFVMGTCLLLSAAQVFFRDVAFMWGAFNMLLFFCTPILYELRSLPQYVRPVFEANPLYPFIRLFQDPMLGNVPPADLITTAVLYAAIMLTIGASVFTRSEKSFYQYL